MRPYQQCTRCVMDTSDPQIEFDSNGVCNHCRKAISRWQELKKMNRVGSDNLDHIIQKIKKAGRDKKYDVVLGISGGIDSCYTAYVLKKHNVRTLLVHMDNGWNSVNAIQNIRSVAERFSFDYECHVLDWEEFRIIQLAFLKASVVEVETPTDIAIVSVLHKAAAKHGIKYIVSGTNLKTESILPKLWHYNAKDKKYFNHITKVFGKKKFSRFPTFGYLEEAYYKLVKGIQIIYLLNYIDLKKDEMAEELRKEIDLKDYGIKHHESHYTKFVQSYLLVEKFNLDYRKATLSSKICSGLLTRDEAIKELQKPAFNAEDVEKQKAYVAKKLSISVEELNEIIAAPGKYYYEYPNNEKKLEMIYGIYRRFLIR